MAFKQIELNGRPISPHKAIVEPDFQSKTVLVADTWEYVAMWLTREHQSDALFYWQQARNFFEASRNLPNTSSPLTLYYCFLNAVKALLVVRKVTFTELHGVHGESQTGKTSLGNEIIEFEHSGVLPALCGYLGEAIAGTHSLQDLLYNLIFIHRAYKLTFSSQPELFVPIVHPRFVKVTGVTGAEEAWFCADIEDREASQRTVNKLPGFEQDIGVEDRFTIRRKKRFRWRKGIAHRAANLAQLRSYHQKLREHLYYIHGPTRLWYLKRGGDVKGLIRRSSLTLTFAAMHRLSTLARYTPMKLARHFDSHHNWLLSEFVATARSQFVDEVSSEITGQEFMIPGRKGVS